MNGTTKYTLRKLLTDQKNHRRWLSIFLLLALLVSISTVALLTLPSLAWTKEKVVLCCPYALHEHTAACYDANGRLICEYAVSHLHDERCYDDNGELICTLAEVYPHVHDESCYTETQELVCGLEESPGHTHSLECYGSVRGDLICENTDEDHVHTDECYEWTVGLVCGMEEGEGAHTHTDACYETRFVLTCTEQELPQHQHNDDCFTTKELTDETTVSTDETETETETEALGDPTADVESPADWEKTFADVTLTGDWSEDLLAIAGTQLGYRESTRNFQMEDGVRKGYTRYGAWYGAPYGDWCAMFISFCLHYADVPQVKMPIEASCNRWIKLLDQRGLYHDVEAKPETAEATRPTEDPFDQVLLPDGEDAAEAVSETEAPVQETREHRNGSEAVRRYIPRSGDVVFFRMKDKTGSDHVGIVRDVDLERGTLTTVEGNAGNCVQCITYDLNDARIIGYGELPEEPKQTPDAEAETESESETEFASETETEPVPQEELSLVEQYTSSDGKRYTVSVAYHRDAMIPDGSVLSITEPDPVEYADYLAQTAAALGCDEAELENLFLLDITILFEGEEIQPRSPVAVSIRLIDEAPQEDAQVVHFGDEPEVLDSETVDGEIRFETDGFSVYAIVSTTIEQYVLASDGHNYRVSVTYDASAGVPDGAVLEVSEILPDTADYEAYAAKCETALGLDEGSASYLRLFDIKIVDALGQKIEINAPVAVKIELADEQAAEGLAADTQVIHFADDTENGELVSDVSVEGESVSFSADGFSAYAIVSGPEAVESGWVKVASMAELRSYAQAGTPMYIGHVEGYYFMNTTVADSSRTGIKKTAKSNYPTADAAQYYFLPVDGTDDQFYVYCFDGSGNPQYLINENNNSLKFGSQGQTAVFTASCADSVFDFHRGRWYWNMQGGVPGKRFCCYTNTVDPNNNMNLWVKIDPGEDPYNLNGKTFGLMHYTNGLTGKALMAEANGDHTLTALPMTVLTKYNDRTDQLFTPSDSEITRWTFSWVCEDMYTLSATVGGETKYLMVDGTGATLSDDPCNLRVVPGTGAHAGELCFLSESGVALTYSGEIASGFSVGGTVGSEWLHLVRASELTSDYYLTYSADKVSIAENKEDFTQSDVTDGEHVIIYTRTWNETKKRYEFYAIDHDGSLVPVYESGDVIQWIGDRNNSLLWEFTEYHNSDGTPNYYYELQNEYSGMYLAPQVTDGQILFDHTVGVNLNGRRNGYFYTDILSWDDANYAYAGLKVENGRVVSCPKNEADDFYFAIIQPTATGDELTTVSTVDNRVHGITMKLVDFGLDGNTTREGNGPITSVQQHTVMGDSTGGAVLTANTGLLTTKLDANGYPTATKTGASLAELFGTATTVNHLFIQSIYEGTGYFEYDSTQNFASLQNNGNFAVYQELGTSDASSRNTLQHGQFLPYNDLTPGIFANVNPRNLYNAAGQALPDSDPRKNERLYLVQSGVAGETKPDYYFGMELEASFVQTPSGMDNWGHDIIYEFTGDDDFWLYVDGELVIDLGGIHSALAGSVNYATGQVIVNGQSTTLREIFRSNYVQRGMSSAEIEETLDEIFEQNLRGEWVFKDYTTHQMKIYYMERGAGASNLHMRFNLSSVKEGTVLLSKDLSGAEDADSIEAEFPYQIFYRYPRVDAQGNPILDDQGEPLIGEELLTNQEQHGNDHLIFVVYKDTITPVKFLRTLTVEGLTYDNVFMLKPGETAEITFPDNMISYRVVECGVNKTVYDSVGVTLTGGEVAAVTETPVGTNHADYGIDFAVAKDRQRVAYNNHISPDAIRNLTIEKILYDQNGIDLVTDPEILDNVLFSFRLYLGTEYESAPSLANMYPYYVRDPGGNYCRWDTSQQKFISIGKTDFSTLTAEERNTVRFNTSMNGSISKIPAFYTVEVRDLLAGTSFNVEERDWEIPDGYSRVKYELNGTPVVTANGLMPSGQDPDPEVQVVNKKGYGLRIRKLWSDEGFMASREPTFFGIFLGNSTTPLSGTLRQLPQTGEYTLYWYFDNLEAGWSFDQYHIFEAKVTGAVVDSEGYVTSYSSLAKIGNGETLTLSGEQIGDTEPSDFNYTVYYAETPDESNVRLFTARNERPGITLRKSDWVGNPLSGARFTLQLGGVTVGTYTSDADGLITIAYLARGVDYTLTETRTPTGYHGLREPLVFRVNSDNSVTIDGETPIPDDPNADDSKFYRLSTDTAGLPVITVKNHAFGLQFIKVDSATQQPIAGTVFELHRAITINNVTEVDYDHVMPGYGNMTTDENGVIQELTIPRIENELPPGTYYLKEVSPTSGYGQISGYIRFTISDIGIVTLDNEHSGWLQTTGAGTNNVNYLVTIPNERVETVRVLKKGLDGHTLKGASFSLYRAADFSAETHQPKPNTQPILSGTTDNNGVLVLGDLPFGNYYLLETAAPAGYVSPRYAVSIAISDGAVTALHGNDHCEVTNPSTGVWQVCVYNNPGLILPATGGSGVLPFYLFGGLLLLSAAAVLLFRKRHYR